MRACLLKSTRKQSATTVKMCTEMGRGLRTGQGPTSLFTWKTLCFHALGDLPIMPDTALVPTQHPRSPLRTHTAAPQDGGADGGGEGGGDLPDLPDSIKLGLGDFIFYSMLVGRAAMYDFMTGACRVEGEAERGEGAERRRRGGGGEAEGRRRVYRTVARPGTFPSPDKHLDTSYCTPCAILTHVVPPCNTHSLTLPNDFSSYPN